MTTERKLWEHGIQSWAELEATYEKQYSLFENLSLDQKVEALRESREAFRRKDASFFAARLPTREHYRIAASFPRDTVFLDIETTGLSFYYDHITVIGVSRADRYACHIASSRNANWRELLDGAKCLVTFNGTLFDLKFLALEFPDLKLPEAHVDLRFLGRRVGLNGAQKTIEKALRIERGKDLANIRGVDAALLWYDYKAGNVSAGELLVEYNHADIEGMKAILDEAIKRLAEGGGPAPTVTNGTHFSKFKSSIKFAQSGQVTDKTHLRVPRFKGRKGPRVNFEDLAKVSQIRSLSVVGIDLTGSSKRPTGWCLLKGRRAETRLLRTDSELIAATVDAAPDLVSIDSPLSLPVGRRTVRDTDRGRDKYGITRECERILRSRGVSVYPCLIPSMQALTARGIRLAKTLRSLGLPVIESYPGAAQDIMNIPRKRASLAQLKGGLGLFGIKGEFLTSRVTHDEVDAITSAVVGIFHWSGKFEALGNDKEDYLIIPDLDKDADPWRNRRVIGISGPISAGKTTAAHHLESRSFATVQSEVQVITIDSAVNDFAHDQKVKPKMRAIVLAALSGN